MNQERLVRVRARMKTAGVDLLSLPPGDDLLYLLDYSPHPDERPCWLFLTQGDAVFLVPDLNAGQARTRTDLPFLTYADAEGPSRVLAQARDRLGSPQRVAAADTMRADFLLLIQELWPKSAFVPGARVMAPVRMIKTAEEIELLRRSAAAADAAVDAGFAASRPGATETSVARAIQDAFIARGAQEPGFAIVAGGPNSAFPHHSTGGRAIRPDEPVLLDIGARLDGYCSDITRMGFLGKPTASYLEIHSIVERAASASMDAVKPGAPISAVDRAARGVIEAAGYGKYFTHRTGHGIGISGHEPPSVMETNDLVMQEGMAFSIEPGIYIEGRFGVRLEDIVVVTGRGAERLSGLPREVRVLQG